MSIYKRDFKNRQKGAALVEFAIVVPLLLLLALGIIEFSYAFYHLNILNKSVQDAARYFSDSQIARYNGSAYDPSYPINVTATNSAYKTKAQNLVIYGNTTGTGNALMPSAGNYTVNVTKPDADHAMVTATYNHNFILGNVLNNFSALGIQNPFPLTASSVLRVE